jgi:hypothetical protein
MWGTINDDFFGPNLIAIRWYRRRILTCLGKPNCSMIVFWRARLSDVRISQEGRIELRENYRKDDEGRNCCLVKQIGFHIPSFPSVR